MSTWQLQDAKAHLSQLVRDASSGKPQRITYRGKPVVVVLSTEDYEKLKKRKKKLVKFMRQSPLVGLNLDIVRDQSPMREIDL